MKISVRELKYLIAEVTASQPRKLYHGSSRELKIGSVMRGGRFSAESGFGMLETYAESLRPKDCISRFKGIFMVSRPSDIYSAGGSTDFVYEVEPIGKFNRYHFSWMGEAYNVMLQLASRASPLKLTKRELAQAQEQGVDDMIMNYWNGARPPKGSNDYWEYLAGSVKIVRRVSDRY